MTRDLRWGRRAGTGHAGAIVMPDRRSDPIDRPKDSSEHWPSLGALVSSAVVAGAGESSLAVKGWSIENASGRHDSWATLVLGRLNGEPATSTLLLPFVNGNPFLTIGRPWARGRRRQYAGVIDKILR